jgi:hypothetical protein
MSEHRLSEIVIERPRGGRRISLKKTTGSKKFLHRLTQEAIEDGLLTPYLLKPRNKTKRLSDHLNPLRRLLRSKVGLPWSQVHSELSQRLDASTMAGRHVLDHVRDYVTENVDMVEGVPYSREGGWRHGKLLGTGYHEEFYVHPDTGMLCLAAKQPRVSLRIVPDDWVEPVDSIRADRHHRYQKIDEVWYWVTLADLPVNVALWDVVKKTTVRSKTPGARYAVDKQQCSKRDLKSLRRRYPQV